jgi:hypothetical protein
MKIFKELKKLGYIHYSATTIEELDDLPLNSAERVSEQALVLRWFREKHNLIGGVEYIGGMKPATTWWDIYVVGYYNIDHKEMSMKYQPYEEAELACLKKLIEIVKNKPLNLE